MSRAFHLRRPAPGSTTLLAGFVLATLGLALALALNALGTARSQRETVEAVLSDYAGIAASEYVRIGREGLATVAGVAFDEVPRRERPGRMPDPAEVGWDLDDAADALDCPCPALSTPRLLFRYDRRTGDMVVRGPDAPAPDAAGLVRRVAEAGGSGAGRYGIVRIPSRSGGAPDRIVLHASVFDAEGAAVMVYGVLLEAVTLEELARHWYERHALLPEAISPPDTDPAPVRISLTWPDGEVVYSSVPPGGANPPAGAPTGGPHRLPEHWGSLAVHAGIRPEAAGMLVIGGVPGSRLPFSLALLALTLAVGAAGLWEVRRHHQLGRLREDFISSVSHELRTPLTQIRMLAELQADGKLRTEEERTRASRVMAREARRLTHLVENILNFSRTRGRHAPPLPPLRPIPLADYLHDTADAFRPLMGTGRVEVHADPDVVALGDRDTLRQILGNFLDNAVKYGPPGQTIRLTAEATGRSAFVHVDDEGPGIPPDARLLVWEPYRRLPRDVDGSVPGSGVGLAVVRALADTMRGRVSVVDAPGGGARFTLELQVDAGVPVHDRPNEPRPRESHPNERVVHGAHPTG